MRFQISPAILVAIVLWNSIAAWAEDKPAVIPEKFKAAFGLKDNDQDQRLSLDEFLVDRNPADVARRDFKLFDFDENGFLDLAEFAAVPDVAGGPERGALSDPMHQIVEILVRDLDKFFGEWNKNPEMEIQAVQFLQNLNNHFAGNNIRFNNSSIDENRNGTISSDEAKRFLEMQLGIRRGDGKPLRRSDGVVFNYMLFLHLDQNKNSLIEHTEFLERAFFTEQREQEFKDADADQDGMVTFEEWWNYPLRGSYDPVNEFRRMDTDLDGFVSPAELKAGTDGWKSHVAAHAFPGFDLDRDGKFSLFEYRLSPQANMVLPWDWKMTDNDGNMVLTFNEFYFDATVFPPMDRQEFPFLRYMVFHRLDLNSNNQLEPSEYFFKTKTPDEFFIMNEDGTGWKSLFLFAGHHACGSVAVSPDGESIAFDSWPGDQQAGSAIFVMNLEEKQPRQLCTGMMPNWSKDGQLLVCSRNDQRSGFWFVEVNGNGREYGGAGWGAQWSPDGRQIAVTQGPELKVFNVDSEDYTTIINRESSPYQQIFWNIGWSPDGSRLCFKGIKQDGTQEVATVNVAGDEHKIKLRYSNRNAINADFAWHPTQNRVIFAMVKADSGLMQLYEFDPTKDDPPQLVKGQDETRNNTDVCWTPDGKQLIIVSGDF